MARDFMLCIYCRNGDHEVPLPIDEPCSCICHDGGLALTLKTGAGWLAVVLFGGVDTRMNLHRAVRKAKVAVSL